MSDPIIIIEFNSDRTLSGNLTLMDGPDIILAGPYEALGLADSSAAKAKGNPDRDPTHIYGDTPTGTYNIPGMFETGTGTRYSERSYGNAGALILEPIEGEAKKARLNGRSGLLIHGGATRNGELRPTHGCIRLFNEDLAELIEIIWSRDSYEKLLCQIVEVDLFTDLVFKSIKNEDISDPPIIPAKASRLIPQTFK